MNEQRTISVLVQVQVTRGNESEELGVALSDVAVAAAGGARAGKAWAAVDPGGGPPDPGLVGKAAT